MSHLIPDSAYISSTWFIQYIPDTIYTSVIWFMFMLLTFISMFILLNYTHKQSVRYSILVLLMLFLIELGGILELREYSFERPILHTEKAEYMNQYNNITCIDEFKIKRECIIRVTTSSVSYPFGFGGKSSSNIMEVIEVE